MFWTSLALRSLTSTGSSSLRSTFATRSFSSSSTTTCLSWSRWGWHRHCWLEENHQPGRIHERGNRVGHGGLWNGLAGGGTLLIFDDKLWFFRIASTCLRDRWECSASWRRNLYFQRSSHWTHHPVRSTFTSRSMLSWQSNGRQRIKHLRRSWRRTTSARAPPSRNRSQASLDHFNFQIQSASQLLK